MLILPVWNRRYRAGVAVTRVLHNHSFEPRKPIGDSALIPTEYRWRESSLRVSRRICRAANEVSEPLALHKDLLSEVSDRDGVGLIRVCHLLLAAIREEEQFGGCRADQGDNWRCRIKAILGDPAFNCLTREAVQCFHRPRYMIDDAQDFSLRINPAVKLAHKISLVHAIRSSNYRSFQKTERHDATRLRWGRFLHHAWKVVGLSPMY